MAIMTQKKGGKRQIFLVIVLIILAVIVGVYLYSTRKEAPSAAIPAGPEAITEEAVLPGAEVSGMAGLEAKEVMAIRPEALAPERITRILASLEKLDLVLYGKLPIEVDPKEIGRTNPFVAP